MSWWHRFRPASQLKNPRPRHVIVLYSRPGCHLCDDAEAILRSRADAHQLTIEKRNVDDEPAMANEYGECVPVVLVNGKLRFRGRVSPALLDRLLRADSHYGDDSPAGG